MVKRYFSIAMGIAACVGTPAVTSAEEAVRGWYGGLGVGISRVEPDTGGTTFSVDESQSSGAKLYVGYDLNDRWAVEGYYSDQGEATLNPTGSIEYRDVGISAMYYFYEEEEDRRGWSAFVRAGLGSMSNDTDVNYNQRNDTHVMYGAGILLPLGENWGARFDVDLYDKDSQLVSVGLVWNFGSRAAPAKEPEPRPEPQPKPEPRPEPEPQPVAPADSDADGVINEVDQCPDTAADAKVDDKGCELRPVLVLEGVNFLSGSADLTGDSQSALDKVAASLMRYPELQVEVAGYTDSKGARASNVRLSQQRAETVRNYLVSQGVAQEMLTAKGFGPDDPIADNATAKGRAVNRRVELHIDQAEPQKETQKETGSKNT